MGLQFELEDANNDQGDYIDDGTVLQARVVGHNLKDRTIKGETVKKVGWKFQVESDGPYFGRTVWGDTSTKFVKHPNCKLYSWSEAVLGQKLPAGYRIDLDHLLDRECRIVVAKDTWNGPDQEVRMRNYVSEVHPSREAAAAMALADDQEPF